MSVDAGRRRLGSEGPGAWVGANLPRVDGRLKVTGRADYAADRVVANVTHATLVTSTIARGRVTAIDTAEAERAPGFLGIFSHLNLPPLPDLKSFMQGGASMQAVMPLRDDQIHHAGQIVAIVVAETLEQSRHAAELVHVSYDVEEPRGVLEDHAAEAYPPGPGFGGSPPDHTRGDPQRALAEADVTVAGTFTTPIEHHNPMEPFASIASWEDGSLLVHDTNQGVNVIKMGLCEALGLPPEKVRVLSPFVGGGFGAKGSIWPHTILAVIAAREVGRPVKLVMTRAQMYTLNGYRSQTLQEISLGAKRDGTLTAIIHRSTSIGSAVGEIAESSPELSKAHYACPNLETSMRLVDLDIGVPTAMRAPGEAPGSFALESAMDELAVKLGMDPIELRLKNYAETNPENGFPWTSKALRGCYLQGAERFGWARRNPEPRSMRDGRLLVGYGMASAYFPTVGFPAQALAILKADGTAVVRSATSDLGTGTYTVMTQVAADALGLPPDRITFELGDTNMPFALVAGGSATVRSVGPAVRMAGQDARQKLIELAVKDEESPLAGYGSEAVGAEDGELFLTHAPDQREAYGAILARHSLDEIAGDGGVEWSTITEQFGVGAFGAQFVEVHVDPDLGLIRVARALGAFDIGTVLNPITARSQAVGGMVWGVGMALLEQSILHPRLAAFASPNLAGYLVPVHADIPTAFDAFFVQEGRDEHINSLGAKGVGEIGIVGVAAAIANAVYHATGVRIRDLPLTPEKLLAEG